MSEVHIARTLNAPADVVLAAVTGHDALVRWVPGVPEGATPVDAGPDQVRLTADPRSPEPEPGDGVLVRVRAEQYRVEWSRPGTAATGWLQVNAEGAADEAAEVVVHLSVPEGEQAPGSGEDDAAQALDALAGLVVG